MLLKPEGLVGRRVRPAAVDVDDDEDAVAWRQPPPPPRVEAIPAWLRERWRRRRRPARPPAAGGARA